jgi:outer membrane protein assembly factor BamB
LAVDTDPDLTRRRLLLAGAGLVSTAGLGAVIWQASRPDASRPQTATREPPARRQAAARPRLAATREPPARRAPIWQAEVSIARPQVLAAADGVVCVAGDQGAYLTASAYERLQTLNARDGSHMWTFTVPTGRRGDSYLDPPNMAVSGGRVYAALDNLTCLRAGDGTKVWSDSVPVTINLAAGPDAVYAVQETLFALRSRDGSQLWSYPADATAMPAPVLVNGVLYLLGSDRRGDAAVLAIRASDGVRLWDSPGPDMGWLACDGSTVCAISGIGMEPPANGVSPPTQLWTYQASDGRLLYKSAPDAGFNSAPAVTAGIACAFTGKLNAVNPANGQILWSSRTTGAQLAAARGRFYTSTPEGDLVALNAGDGAPVWQCPIRFTLGPVVAGNTIYVCDNTTLYAVRA